MRLQGGVVNPGQLTETAQDGWIWVLTGAQLARKAASRRDAQNYSSSNFKYLALGRSVKPSAS